MAGTTTIGSGAIALTVDGRGVDTGLSAIDKRFQNSLNKVRAMATETLTTRAKAEARAIAEVRSQLDQRRIGLSGNEHATNLAGIRGRFDSQIAKARDQGRSGLASELELAKATEISLARRAAREEAAARIQERNAQRARAGQLGSSVDRYGNSSGRFDMLSQLARAESAAEPIRKIEQVRSKLLSALRTNVLTGEEAEDPFKLSHVAKAGLIASAAINGLRVGTKLMKSDLEGAVDALKELPFGVGQMVGALHDFLGEITGANREIERMNTIAKRAEQIASNRQQASEAGQRTREAFGDRSQGTRDELSVMGRTGFGLAFRQTNIDRQQAFRENAKQRDDAIKEQRRLLQERLRAPVEPASDAEVLALARKRNLLPVSFSQVKGGAAPGIESLSESTRASLAAEIEKGRRDQDSSLAKSQTDAQIRGIRQSAFRSNALAIQKQLFGTFIAGKDSLVENAGRGLDYLRGIRERQDSNRLAAQDAETERRTLELRLNGQEKEADLYTLRRDAARDIIKAYRDQNYALAETLAKTEKLKEDELERSRNYGGAGLFNPSTDVKGPRVARIGNANERSGLLHVLGIDQVVGHLGRLVDYMATGLVARAG